MHEYSIGKFTTQYHYCFLCRTVSFSSQRATRGSDAETRLSGLEALQCRSMCRRRWLNNRMGPSMILKAVSTTRIENPISKKERNTGKGTAGATTNAIVTGVLSSVAVATPH